MASPSPNAAAGSGLVAGTYRVDFGNVIAGAAPPRTAYAAQAERTGEAGFMAIAVARGWPARSRALASVTGAAIPNLITPLAHGAAQKAGEAGYFVICPAPPGPSLLATLRPWSETEVLDHLLRPVVNVLAELQSRNLTHRAIRADNLFQLGQSGSVTVGDAWSAPPACHQPDWMEPIYSAACLPSGRGDGSIADDVYALGALMLMLSVGQNPFEGVDPETLHRRKLDLGSYAALVGTQRLPNTVSDLLRGMLADDPEHRPSLALLTDPQAARSRRVAARPPRRAQRALEIGSDAAFTGRMLAYALKRQPEQGASLLRSGVVGRWLQRGIGDGQVASQIDELVNLREGEAAAGDLRADAQLITRAIAVLDASAPLTWRSVSIWPDGLGPALDYALNHAKDQVGVLTEIAARQVARSWSTRRPAKDAAAARLETKEANAWFQASQGEGGSLRLNYTLNPLAPCGSPLLTGHWVTRTSELLPALEATAAASSKTGATLVDNHISAFVNARRDERMDIDISQLANALSPSDLMSQLRLLARLQQKMFRGNLPALSKWAVQAAEPLLDTFSSKSRRDRLTKALKAMGEGGQLPIIVAFMDSKPERASDEVGLVNARARVATIDVALNAIERAREGRAFQAKHMAQEVTGALGLLAGVIGLAAALFA